MGENKFFSFKIQYSTKKIFHNFLSLSSVQFLDMLLPLVTLPYVIRIIGLEYFGRIAFAQALVGYLVILVNYGFHLTGTQEIAVNKNRIKKVRKLFYEVTSAKLILLFFSLLILECVLAIFPSLNSIRIIYYLVFIQLMSMCMVPNFFLQVMQDL